MHIFNHLHDCINQPMTLVPQMYCYQVHLLHHSILLILTMDPSLELNLLLGAMHAVLLGHCSAQGTNLLVIVGPLVRHVLFLLILLFLLVGPRPRQLVSSGAFLFAYNWDIHIDFRRVSPWIFI